MKKLRSPEKTQKKDHETQHRPVLELKKFLVCCSVAIRIQK
jgi:hypothetical protein